MTTITTHYITQDLASPYADIERLPRLTAEEEAQLLHDLHLAQKAHSAKVRLIEGYLPRVLTLAKQYDRRYRVITFDDLVQEGSLALMQAIDKCAVMPITKSLSCYIGTVVRSAFARAIATDAPIHMPNSTWHYIHNTGRAQDYAWMRLATPMEKPLPRRLLLPHCSCRLVSRNRSSSSTTNSAVSLCHCWRCCPNGGDRCLPCATG